MQYTTLGKTDVKVSRICLGTMTWGHQNTESEAHEQMDYALEQGVNFWDTAELYAVPISPETQGLTEKYIGTWFAKNPQKRKDVILATKIAGAGIDWINGNEGITPKTIKRAVEDSLKRLQTDYIDLYQLHWPNRDSYNFDNFWNFNPDGSEPDASDEYFISILETLQEFIDAGKIRHIGLSNETAWGTMKFLQLAEKHNLPRVVSSQNEYSLICRRVEPDLSEVIVREKVGLLAWSPLAMGILTGKYQNGNIPEGSRLSNSTESVGWRMTKQCHKAVDKYLEIAKKHGLDPAQMAIAFTLSKPFTTASIIGATSMQQLKTDIVAIDVKLSDEVLSEIEAARKEFPIVY